MVTRRLRYAPSQGLASRKALLCRKIMFSDNEKQSTASWRERIVERDIDGRRSHVRKRDRPSVVRVLFNIPSRESIWQYITEIHATNQIRRDLPSFCQNERKHGFRSQTPEAICGIL